MTSSDIPAGGMRGAEAIRAALADMPASPGVYCMRDEKGEALYVGKARSLKNRVAHYAQAAQLPYRLQRMVMATRRVETTLAASEAEALILEASLVKTLKPRYNILLKDDKSFPYIHFSAHAFPRIGKYRGSRKEKGDYFGPFVSAGAVERTIALLQKAFLLRSCSDNVFKNRTRPCLQYQIKRCSAPCVRYIEGPAYEALAAQAKRFLSGRGQEIQAQIAGEMRAAADATDFERAALLRDRLRAIALVQSHGGIAAPEADTDIFACVAESGIACVQMIGWRGGMHRGGHAYFPAHVEAEAPAEILSAFIAQYYQERTPPARVLLSDVPADAGLLAEALSMLAKKRVSVSAPSRGEGRQLVEMARRNAQEMMKRHLRDSARQEKALAAVAEALKLPALPRRIEVYDNSHVSGAHAVGAMIVAGPEGFEKKSYRIFNIRSADLAPGDDYAMLREVLFRRFRRLLAQEEEGAPAPDLVLIDGGTGQLSAAMEVFGELGIGDICLAAIAKGPERNAGREWFHLPGREPFQLPAGDAALYYLQVLRDEAHRFAVGAHRKRRSKAAQVSPLDGIESVGVSRKRALLNHFGSGRAVANAGIEEIARVPGLSRAMAEKIYAYFH